MDTFKLQLETTKTAVIDESDRLLRTSEVLPTKPTRVTVFFMHKPFEAVQTLQGIIFLAELR